MMHFSSRYLLCFIGRACDRKIETLWKRKREKCSRCSHSGREKKTEDTHTGGSWFFQVTVLFLQITNYNIPILISIDLNFWSLLKTISPNGFQKLMSILRITTLKRGDSNGGLTFPNKQSVSLFFVPWRWGKGEIN